MSFLNTAGVDFGSDSDSEDDDYVPTAEAEDSDDHEVTSGEECAEETGDALKSGKRKKKGAKKETPRKRKGGIKLDEEEKNGNNDEGAGDEEKGELELIIESKKEEAEKKRADSLWADFMQDTKPKPAPKPVATGIGGLGALVKPITSSPSAKPEKVTVTKVYNFAGEAITVSEQVDVGSKAATESANESPDKSSEPVTSEDPATTPIKSPSGPKPPAAKPAAGLSGILGQISGKPKMSVLEKTRLDWNQFKNAEGIQEELQTFNRGKDGYLERQAFLQRSDLRQFEIEKSLRNITRAKR